MEYVGLQAMKQAYAQQKVDDGDYDRGLKVYSKEITEPIFEGLAFHPEAELLKDSVDEAFSDIAIDCAALEKEISYAANNYSSLVTDMLSKLEAIDQSIQVEADRVKDINIICGNYDMFGTVKAINGNNVTGSFNYENNAFTGVISDESDSITLTVNNVTGNGIEGNEFVESIIDVIRDNLVDGDSLTSWEYSRYNSNNPPKAAPMVINTDNEEARVTITLSSEDDYEFNTVKLTSSEDIILENVLVSTDGGLTYSSCLDDEIHLNDNEAKYNDPNYAYNTGLIAFPSTNFLRLQVRSNGVSDDTVIDEDGDELEDVSRHYIAIDDITASNATYSSASFETAELTSKPLDCIAIYANEYVPNHFLDDTTYVQYLLTVNGIEYEMVPINSDKSGTKVIRFSDYTVGDSYVTHLNESIKSASLKVIINTTSDGQTPYLSNLKICLGKVVS